MKQILVVEDDVMLNSGLCYNLELDAYKAVPAHDAAAALEKIRDKTFDLVIMDVNLPDGDGFELCKKISAARDIPIIFLTARDLEADVVKGFDLGADDYLTKPFGTGELLARTRTSLRRSQLMKGDFDTQQSDVFKASGLTIDYIRHKVTVDGKEVHLTQKEFRIISILEKYSGRVLTYDYLIKNLWGPEYNNDTQTLRVYMAHIWRKIEKNPATPKYIMTEVGIGYRMIEED